MLLVQDRSQLASHERPLWGWIGERPLKDGIGESSLKDGIDDVEPLKVSLLFQRSDSTGDLSPAIGHLYQSTISLCKQSKQSPPLRWLCWDGVHLGSDSCSWFSVRTPLTDSQLSSTISNIMAWPLYGIVTILFLYTFVSWSFTVKHFTIIVEIVILS